MVRYFIFIGILLSININAQFIGHSGVYYLGTADIPISNSNYANPNINGAVIRFKWNSVEPTPGNFNWAYVDAEIAKAKANNKKISLQPLGKPLWLDSIGATKYYYIDKSPFSPSFGKAVSEILPWDSIYVSRYKIFLKNLSLKYANNPIVTYVNAVGVNFSRGLPDTVIVDTINLIKKPFWTTFKYNADTLGYLMNKITDYYMGLFPTTPMWCSVDYVTFQPNASGQARNYLATIYCNYGIAKYPNRFGLFREDVAGCNPNISSINSGSHWYIMQKNPCRTGGQMLWNVQDGPARMNQCGILPNTKAVVFDSAVDKGIVLGMRYLEVYAIDILDATLSTSMQQANNKLIGKGNACNSVLPIQLQYFNGTYNNCSVTLSWVTAIENNFQLFKIQRSVDGITWEVIGIKSGFGNSAQTRSYSFIDNKVVGNKYLYRLEQIDFDSRSTFSNIISINIEKCSSDKISIYPNPITNYLNIIINDTQSSKRKYLIYNSSGVVVKEFFLSKSTQINLSSLPNGLYFLLCSETGYQRWSFIKQ